MKLDIASTATGLAIAIVLAHPSTAGAAEIKVVCSNGFKAVMEDLAPKFERASQHTVVVRYGLAASLKLQIERGEAFDLAILTPAAIDDLIKAHSIAAGSRTTLARSGLAIEIRAGAPRPDIGTADAFKRALAAAKSIAYAREGASGVAFAALIQRLGMADALRPKSRLTATGEEVSDAVLRGDVQFGVLPLSEILPVRGVEVLGTFPADLQSYIVMVAGVNASAGPASAAADLIAFLTAPSTAAVLKTKGMER